MPVIVSESLRILYCPKVPLTVDCPRMSRTVST